MTEGARRVTPPPHGTVAEEAAKLADAAREWLADRSKVGHEDVWAQATATSGDPPECHGCPICRARRAFGSVSPEVLDHLGAAAASLAAAARGMARPDGRTGHR